MAVMLSFSGTLCQSDPKLYSVLLVGQTSHLSQLKYDDIKMKFGSHVDNETFSAAIAALHPSPTDTCSMYLNTVTVAALPRKCSRHNTQSRAHNLTKIVKNCFTGQDEFIVLVCERSSLLASGAAIARAFPLYTAKSNVSEISCTVTVEVLLVDDEMQDTVNQEDVEALDAVAHGVRLAAKITDMPCSEMHTDAFLGEINIVGKEFGINAKIIQGEALRKQGFGGIYGVGKAARHAPALAILSHKPIGAIYNIAWVGKGIVYDTGGLCLKSKMGLPGMKRDCGGAAGVLGAFYTAVKLGFNQNLHAVFCLAENAISADAMLPDDVLKMYSGRTVEVNNTDAEGRLVLGDGVVYASRDLNCDTVVDMATLTGAQGIATGKYHAAILSNSEGMEAACVVAGCNSGDLVHPLPYTPELHFSEFSSSIADMKNSVSDRSNAQVSCAGLFIQSHLGFDYSGTWLHIDIASPVSVGERATGYGVALLTVLFGSMSGSQLVQDVAPSTTDDTLTLCGERAVAKKMRLH